MHGTPNIRLTCVFHPPPKYTWKDLFGRDFVRISQYLQLFSNFWVLWYTLAKFKPVSTRTSTSIKIKHVKDDFVEEMSLMNQALYIFVLFLAPQPIWLHRVQCTPTKNFDVHPRLGAWKSFLGDFFSKFRIVVRVERTSKTLPERAKWSENKFQGLVLDCMMITLYKIGLILA